jgi:hypothetical protein
MKKRGGRGFGIMVSLDVWRFWLLGMLLSRIRGELTLKWSGDGGLKRWRGGTAC